MISDKLQQLGTGGKRGLHKTKQRMGASSKYYSTVISPAATTRQTNELNLHETLKEAFRCKAREAQLEVNSAQVGGAGISPPPSAAGRQMKMKSAQVGRAGISPFLSVATSTAVSMDCGK